MKRIALGRPMFALAVLGVALAPGSHSGGTTVLPTVAPSRAASLCDLKHPLDVKITAMDAAKSGFPLALRVSVGGAMDFENVAVELLGADGARTIGVSRMDLGSTAPGRPGSGTFIVSVPAEGRRFLATFRVTAEGPAGPVSRMAVYNILPHGPADAGTIVKTPEGEGLVVYVNSAKEIGR